MTRSSLTRRSSVHLARGISAVKFHGWSCHTVPCCMTNVMVSYSVHLPGKGKERDLNSENVKDGNIDILKMIEINMCHVSLILEPLDLLLLKY